jgi:plastocyanin
MLVDSQLEIHTRQMLMLLFENGNVTFTADNEGIFPYYCKYHLPLMVGQLAVLP